MTQIDSCLTKAYPQIRVVGQLSQSGLHLVLGGNLVPGHPIYHSGSVVVVEDDTGKAGCSGFQGHLRAALESRWKYEDVTFPEDADQLFLGAAAEEPDISESATTHPGEKHIFVQRIPYRASHDREYSLAAEFGCHVQDDFEPLARLDGSHCHDSQRSLLKVGSHHRTKHVEVHSDWSYDRLDAHRLSQGVGNIVAAGTAQIRLANPLKDSY